MSQRQASLVGERPSVSPPALLPLSLAIVNENHARLCPSPEWAEFMHTEVLPWLVERAEIGPVMIEVGPGPGATTEWLRHRVDRLVAVEIDPAAAERLRQRFADTNVEVVNADATAMQFDAASFDSAGSFTMLHHVPTPQLQDQLLAEVARVLRPGGVFIGSDSAPSDALREFHEGDTYNPIDPAEFGDRLRAAGFSEASVEAREHIATSFIAIR
jgi:ubiquinone/menaquinone biosynthesis C-methylase UbiE